MIDPILEPLAARRKTLLFAAAALLAAALAGAQTAPGEPDPAQVRLRFGPIWASPALSLTNAGVDTNIFNEADVQHPKRDLTMTVTPQTSLWLRIGRTWLSGLIKEDIVWFKKYADQRSRNNSYAVGWLVPLSRISLKAGASWLKTHDRPGFEIDARSKRSEQGINAAIEIHALPSTFFGVRGERRTVDFDRSAVFLGSSLRDELNRTTTTGAVTFRHALTPLTSFTIDAGREQTRFAFSPLRDSNSTNVSLGLRFEPLALVSGSAQVGFRDFVPLSAGLAGYRGSTALVDLSYVAFGATRLGLQASRDVQYSYDINEPYYLQTGLSVLLTQQVYGPLDVEGRAGTQRLAYRVRPDAAIPAPDRTDRVRTLGAGIGYHIGRDLRLAFNVDRMQRDSNLADHQYHTLRYGAAATYGF
jgi:hypothetical protein